MELIEEHLFPIGVPLLIGEGKAALLGHSAPQFRLPQGQPDFRLPRFTEAWLVYTPRWQEKYSSPT